ncbi:MAG: ATP-binding protein, partial [Chloroflexota bacterium]
ILVNLLSNAAKFTQNGVVELNIFPVRKDRIQFEVKDNGIGISPKKLELIFEPFAQASEGNMYSRPYGGVGLGLAICKRLSNQLGGSLQVSSVQGKGSSFTLTMPLKFGN